MFVIISDHLSCICVRLSLVPLPRPPLGHRTQFLPRGDHQEDHLWDGGGQAQRVPLAHERTAELPLCQQEGAQVDAVRSIFNEVNSLIKYFSTKLVVRLIVV